MISSKIREPVRIRLKITSHTRREIRSVLFTHWLKEEPGTPDVANKYRYDVELLSDGTTIYLLRPANLHKGADFAIMCEGFRKWANGNDRAPRHLDLINEIAALIKTSSAHKVELLNALQRIWDCVPSETVLSDLDLFAKVLRAERALLLAKWLFIEQDVNYWTYSGRYKLRHYLEKEFGPLTQEEIKK